MDELRDGERSLLKELQRELGYDFRDEALLFSALCHSSYVYELSQSGRILQNNERLEFLGDAVVDLVVCEMLYRDYPGTSEGDMAKVKGAVASEEVLSQLAREINLNRYIFLGRGEEKTGGRDRNSILADAFEALCAAIYLDGGLSKVAELFGDKFKRQIDVFLTGQRIFDYKTALQEITQERYRELPEYRFVGTDEQNRFVVELYVRGERLSVGVGNSKKEAEKDAARKAYGMLQMAQPKTEGNVSAK